MKFIFMILAILPNIEPTRHEEECRGEYTHKKYHNSIKSENLISSSIMR